MQLTLQTKEDRRLLKSTHMQESHQSCRPSNALMIHVRILNVTHVVFFSWTCLVFDESAVFLKSAQPSNQFGFFMACPSLFNFLKKKPSFLIPTELEFSYYAYYYFLLFFPFVVFVAELASVTKSIRHIQETMTLYYAYIFSPQIKLCSANHKSFHQQQLALQISALRIFDKALSFMYTWTEQSLWLPSFHQLSSQRSRQCSTWMKLHHKTFA